MLEADIVAIESAFGVILPEVYCTVLLNYPGDLLEAMYGTERLLSPSLLYPDAQELIRVNRWLRTDLGILEKGVLGPWPNRFLGIGTDEGGDYWCIDVTDQSGQVWHDHERGEFHSYQPSLPVFVEGLRDWREKWRKELSITAMLRASDSAVAGSTEPTHPVGFDRDAALAAVQAFRADAEALLGLPLYLFESRDETAPFKETAMFFAEVGIFAARAIGPGGPNAFYYQIAFRFSYFGRLASRCPDRAKPDAYRIPQLIALLPKHGFVYIERDSLLSQYNGKFPYPGGWYTWWERFFGWW